ncbi:MAG: glutamyl-tRNA reductase [Planctomyces sp.]|nr:glutamyl-tRNA reductase [Planctomyces sp.]
MADKCLQIERNPAAHSIGWMPSEDVAPLKPHVVVVGLNHKTASLELRERLAFHKEELPQALSRLRGRAGEGVILSTCNRVEVYATAQDPNELSGNIRGFLSDYHEVHWEEIEPSLYEFSDAEAARHLFQVAGGLDSMVVGEWQIRDQIRKGLAASAKSSAGALPTTLCHLFQGALRAGQRIRESASRDKTASSIGDAAVSLVRREMGYKDRFNVLVIGAGAVGETVAVGLGRDSATKLVIANRTISHGKALAHQVGGKAVSLEQLGSSLYDADVVVSAGDSPGFILTWQMVQAAIAGSQNDTLLIDLGVPRNIDPLVGGLDGVRLYDIDELAGQSPGNVTSEDEARLEAEEIIDEELDRFLVWWHSLEAVTMIKKLKQHAESVRQQELSRSRRKLTGLAPEQLEHIDVLTRSIVNKLLHHPITSLKEEAARSGLMLSGRDLPVSPHPEGIPEELLR